MSHSENLEVRFYSTEALSYAAEKVGATLDMTVKEHKMFDGRRVKGRSVKFNDWKYPVIIDEEGIATYDNYNGAWGKVERLNKFTQQYTVDAARRAAVADGLTHIATVEQGNVVTSRFFPADGEGEVVLSVPDNGGAALIDVVNCSGSACQLLTAGLSRAVGVVQSQELKQEYYADQQVRNEETL